MTKRKLELWTVCDNCDKCSNEESVYPVKDLREMPNGEWVCENCFDNFDAEILSEAGVSNWPSCRWSDLAPLPKIGFIEEQTS